MAYRKILRIDNPEEEHFLRMKSKPVETFDDRLAELLDDMQETVRRADGAGLSAVQIGVLKRVFIAIDENGQFVEYVNPQILEQSGSCKQLNEGCLSVPKYYGKVKRPNKVVVKAFDRKGNEFTKTLIGFSSKAVCHEYDHLDGILFIDKVMDNNNK
ncbi:MAG: peptide deformylase [Christensenellales bacterium]